jgi:type IV pilus assembly protein PilA
MSVRKQHGLTLIELMIVVAIIGILAAIAIPNFLKFQCKAKQSEAKTALGAIYKVQLAYTGEYGSYLNTVQLTSYGGLDPKTLTGAKYYRYTLDSLSGGAYVGTAKDQVVKVNTSFASNDTWGVSNGFPVINNINACE